MLGITGTGIHEQTLISIDLLPQGSFFYWRYGHALSGVRVDGPLGRRFLRGLSLTRLWREGCGRAPLNL